MSETTTPTVVPEVSTPAPAASPEPTPAGSSPAAEPTTVSVVSPAAEPSVEPAAAAFTPHTDTPTLLDEISKKPELKAVEPAVEPAPAPPAEPAPEPIVYDFKMPDGVELQPERLGAYTGLLQDARIAADVGQKLLDMHTDVMRQYAEGALAKQHEDFAAMRQQWREQIKGDEMLGGAGFQTVSRAVARMRDMLVPEADRASFNEMLRTTGVGDHPAFWRVLYRAANVFDEAPAPAQAPHPTASPQGPAPRRGVHALFNGKASNSFASR